jgi:hypothetical protein
MRLKKKKEDPHPTLSRARERAKKEMAVRSIGGTSVDS